VVEEGRGGAYNAEEVWDYSGSLAGTELRLLGLWVLIFI
jgi:hypothetical protein